VLSLGSVAATVWGAIAALTSVADDALRTAAGSADDLVRNGLDDAADDVLRQTDDAVNAAGNQTDELISQTTRTIQEKLDDAIAHKTEYVSFELMEELAASGKKYSPDDVVMIVKNTEDELLWLEVGNENAGLTHILSKHQGELASCAIDDVPAFIDNMVKGYRPETLMSSSRGMAAVYLVEGKPYLIAYGKNGFIVSFYPYG